MGKKKTWIGRIPIGTEVDPETGKRKQKFHWVGRFATRRERDRAVEQARAALARGGDPQLPTCDEYVDRFLTEYARTPGRNNEVPKASTVEIQRERLKRFREDFAGRSLDLSRAEIKAWMNGEGEWADHDPVPNGYMPAVTALFNFAIDEDDLPLERNPARKLAKRTKGRAELPPPTPDEFAALLEATSTLDDYAPTIRALLEFAAFTLMRPSELYELRWGDIDFKRNRISKARRVFRGAVDAPKTGEREIALTPPARAAIQNLARSADDDLVFHSVTGKRLSSSGMSGTWARVQAAAGLKFDWYHATKHYGVWHMWTQLGMEPRVIAAQAGWKVSTVDAMLETYGHGEVGALDEVDAAFVDHTPNLRAIDGGKSA
jgi:integrase